MPKEFKAKIKVQGRPDAFVLADLLNDVRKRKVRITKVSYGMKEVVVEYERD